MDASFRAVGFEPKEAPAQTLQGGRDAALCVTGWAARAAQVSVFPPMQGAFIPTLTVDPVSGNFKGFMLWCSTSHLSVSRLFCR